MSTRPPKGMMDDDNTTTSKVLVDNPCWGSPTSHRLEDLLKLIRRETSIVYDSHHYLVLNKPPDLRMDGPYPATVHKLLTYWYPPPSVLKTASPATTTAVNHDQNDDTYPQCNLELLTVVSQLHQHNDARDNFLRPCHQLDYATSGILLVAKTQEAAAHVGRLFEERHEGVRKSYTAIVVGDVQNAFTSFTGGAFKIPVWDQGSTVGELRKQLKILEESHRRTGAARGKQDRRTRDSSKNTVGPLKKQGKSLSYSGGTFQGFQPAHSIFAKWKAKLKRVSKPDAQAKPSENVRKKRRKLNNQSASALLSEEDWNRIWNPVNAVTSRANQTIDYKSLEWKQLGKSHPILREAMIQAADIHNDILRNAIKEKTESELAEEIERTGRGVELPVLFRLSNNNKTVKGVDDTREELHNGSTHDDDKQEEMENTFFVYCPLAQHPSQFRMVVPSKIANEYLHLDTETDHNDVKSVENKNIEHDLNFRPSLTQCTILERGTLVAERENQKTTIPVTKVRLHPITGRRHQLRVHMAIAGFPILGDVTYGGMRFADAVEKTTNGTDETEPNIGVGISSRMCLHARSLQLPSLIGEKTNDWRVTTPDPFEFRPDGNLQPSQD